MLMTMVGDCERERWREGGKEEREKGKRREREGGYINNEQ